jgi:hypothetical protein
LAKGFGRPRPIDVRDEFPRDRQTGVRELLDFAQDFPVAIEL